MNGQGPDATDSGFLLRDVKKGDIPTFFEHQVDREANRLAAFTAKNPDDAEAHAARWNRLLADETVRKQAIVSNGSLVGHIASFHREGRREVTYWIGKEYWGKGLATKALSEFLRRETMRPLYARVANGNIASLRVLEKCGFAVCGNDKGFSNARGVDVEEYILVLAGGS